MLDGALEADDGGGDDVVLEHLGRALNDLSVLASVQVSPEHSRGVNRGDAVRNQSASRRSDEANLGLKLDTFR